MKVMPKRLLSLLLVLTFLVGIVPTAMAAPTEFGADLPDPVEWTDPNEPDNPYPYGLPVDTNFPAELFDVNPYAIAPMSQGSIPDEMWDNSILRALEYTGYDVQWLKDNNKLYNAQYIASSLKNNRPSVLSDIGYYSSGACPNGDETVSDSSTVTGKAPKISYFESNGMVCASFVTYYLCNYMPNIEGVDTSALYEKAKELGADPDHDGVYYLTTVTLWKKVLDYFSTKADGGVTKYTDEDTAYENLVPGDVIVFANDGKLIHIGIYAGEYDLYSNGSSRGVYHFLIHVGNSRGPEINTVEYMVSSGSKASEPIAWYHLDFNDADTPVENPTGYIEIQKEDENGNDLAGAVFTAVNQSTNEQYTIGPTDAKGYAKSGELSLGTYVVTETTFPAGYEASGQTSWTVTISEDTPNLTVTINAVNKRTTGVAQIVKGTTNGGTKAGWHFEVKDANGTVVGNYVTDDTGVIAVELVPGTYTVTETDGEVAYWVNDPNPTRTVTVEAHETAVVTFTNQWWGKAKIIKTLANPEAGTVEGWSFEIQDSAGSVIGTYETDANGEILVDLEPGQYTVTELLEDGSPWQSNPASQTIIVQAGQTAEVTFINALKPGEIRILKTDREDNPLPGAEFLLEYSVDGGQTWQPVWANAEAYPQVGGCTSEGLVDGKMVTGSDGMAVFAGLYPPLQYRLSETAAPEGYQLLYGYAFVGQLPADDFTVTLDAADGAVFALPMTGSNGFALLQNIQTVCLLLCAASLWLFRKKQ